MTNLFSLLRRDQSGSAAIEMAVALPVLVSFIYGIFQLGLVFQANAGVQHALGEASRLATIYPTPTDTEIKAMLTSKKFGTYNGTIKTVDLQTPKDSDGNELGYKTLTISYEQPTDFIFVSGPTVKIDKSKQIYVAR